MVEAAVWPLEKAISYQWISGDPSRLTALGMTARVRRALRDPSRLTALGMTARVRRAVT